MYSIKLKIYLIKILLIAGKKAITKKWGKPDPPMQDQWLDIIEGIYVMEWLTHRLHLQETQFQEKWEKWTVYTGQRQTSQKGQSTE